MSVVSVADVEQANGVLLIAARDILTPLAADRAKELNVRIERTSDERKSTSPTAASVQPIVRAPSKPVPIAANPAGAPSSIQPGAFSGALYRRGAPVPPKMRVTNDTEPETRDHRP